MTDVRWLLLQRRVVELRLRTANQANYTGSNARYTGALTPATGATGGAHAGLLNPAWQPGTEMIEIRAIKIPLNECHAFFIAPCALKLREGAALRLHASCTS